MARNSLRREIEITFPCFCILSAASSWPIQAALFGAAKVGGQWVTTSASCAAQTVRKSQFTLSLWEKVHREKNKLCWDHSTAYKLNLYNILWHYFSLRASLSHAGKCKQFAIFVSVYLWDHTSFAIRQLRLRDVDVLRHRGLWPILCGQHRSRRGHENRENAEWTLHGLRCSDRLQAKPERVQGGSVSPLQWPLNYTFYLTTNTMQCRPFFRVSSQFGPSKGLIGMSVLSGWNSWR